MSYFPNKKGLVSGFVQIGMFFTSTFLILLAEMAINPKGLNPTISVGEDIFFEEIIAKEIKTYILYFFIAIGILGSVSIAFFFPYSPEKVTDPAPLIPEEADNEPSKDNEETEKVEIREEPENSYEVNVDTSPMSLGKVIKTCAFWNCFFITLFTCSK